jgi:hypothetical protein
VVYTSHFVKDNHSETKQDKSFNFTIAGLYCIANPMPWGAPVCHIGTGAGKDE